MSGETYAAIRAYAGEDIEKPHHLPKDTEYLLELTTHVTHFEVLLDDWNDRPAG